jgi:hypothetical protein
LEAALSFSCRACGDLDVGRIFGPYFKIVFSDNSGVFKLFLKTAKGGYVELNCKAETLIANYELALQELDFDLRNRLYYLA